MPRQSLSALSTGLVGVPTRPAPEPPATLSDVAARHWRAFTASRRGDYFDTAALPLLAMLCNALADLERLEEAASGLDPLNDLDQLAKLHRLIDGLRGRASQCLTRLRLTPQAVTDSRSAGRAAKATEPLSGLAAVEALRGIV